MPDEEPLVNNPGLVAPAPFPISLHRSHLYCQRITRSANSSFPVAFQLLPAPKRRAMDALYAFLRISDDLADEPGEIHAKRERLATWRAGLFAAMDGTYAHPIHPALIDTVRRFEIPPALLVEALDGVESDLVPRRFATFADLYPYCYRVASAVGLACVRIWGVRPGVSTDGMHEAADAAEAAGIAFQLTNILRDVKEDLDRGRMYLPEDEMLRFCGSPEQWGKETERFRDFMQFQVARANHYYLRADRLERLLTNEGRAIFRVMAGTYRCLLSEIARDVSRVLIQRVRLPHWRKGLLLLDGWALKWGWF